MPINHDEFIDTTSAEIEEITDQPINRPDGDPVMAVTVALANELQSIYAKDQSKLNDATRTLRIAIHPKH